MFSKPNKHLANDALSSAQRTLELAEETARTSYPHERDFVTAYWLLGAAYLAKEQFQQSEEHLDIALTRCRAINLVQDEPDILLEFAHLYAATNRLTEAQTYAEEALEITDRCGFVLTGADVNLFLAEQAQANSDSAKAYEYAEKAKKLAYCDGPPYYYKVAYLEAEAILNNL